MATTIACLPFGGTRTSSGTLGTDKRFTGQRLDQLDLYFYNARYYDPGIGRFISIVGWAQPTLRELEYPRGSILRIRFARSTAGGARQVHDPGPSIAFSLHSSTAV